MKKFFFLIIIIFIFSFKNSFAHTLNERFIIMGHLYPIVDNEENFQKFVDKVNSYDPNYIFILGDSAIQNNEIFKKFNDSFNAEIFFSPGNHELKNSKENYIKNVGYLNLVLEKKFAKFILLNSSDNIQNIRKNLKKFLSNKFLNGPTIILTHHRIWDDTLISTKPFQHDKSFYFKDIYSLIKDDVEYIFSGNSKRQYFMDLENLPSYGKQNVNNIFWYDKIGSINAFSVGMGDGTPKAAFTIVDILDDQLVIKGDYSTNKNYDVLPKKLIVPNEIRLSKKYNKNDYLFVNKVKFFLFLILSIIIFIFIFFIKKKLSVKS